MEIGILGLAASGKTTLFNLMTEQGSAAVSRREGTGLGGARVPDSRLERLSALFVPKKTTPATIRYADIPGIPAEHGRQGAFNLPELRTMDALMVVVRAFDEEAVPHPLTTVDPVRDLAYIDEEFLLQDQIVIERRLDRLVKDIQKRPAPELNSEHALLERCRALLEEGQPLRAQTFDPNEAKVLRGFTFLSSKPMLVVLNVGEGASPDEASEVATRQWCDRPGVAFTRACATLEGELAELDAADAAAFMAELGIADRALDRIVEQSYELVGLISFFTVGEDECRAWSIVRGTAAVDAAGEIHSDIQRGFIRAEVVRWDALLEAGSLAACRPNGSLRLEGKTYVVADGDVVHFRFNV